MTTANTRRDFIRVTGCAGVATLAAAFLPQTRAEPPMVDPADPQAKALGYVVDAESVDTTKFTRYEPGQLCANCQLYQGAADSEAGPCILFAGKAVAAAGWCNSWVKKA